MNIFLTWFSNKKCFNSLYQSRVDARSAKDTIPERSVVTETMKLLWNSFYVCQVIDRIWHTETMLMINGIAQRAINRKIFKSLNNVSREPNKRGLVTTQIDHCEPIAVSVCSLQQAKIQKFMLFTVFHINFNTDTFWELEINIGALYLAPVLEELNNCNCPPRKVEREALRKTNSDDSIKGNVVQNFFIKTCCDNHKEYDRRETNGFKEEVRCTEMIFLCSKFYDCHDANSDKYKLSIKRTG